MKVKATFLPVLLLAGACAFAQQSGSAPTTNPPAATDQATPSATDQNSNMTTIHGCLGKGSDNTYTVTEDKSGMVYTLAGKDFSSLSSHVGQEVEADGQSAAAATSTKDANQAAAATPVNAFQVTHMRKVGDKCTSTKSPTSALPSAGPVMMAAAFAPQTSGSTAPQSGNSGPAASGSTGMSTSPQTTTPGQSTPSTATPTTPAPTTPGTVDNSTPGATGTPGTQTGAPGSATTPGTTATPGGAGSSNGNSTAGSQAPCGTDASATAGPCSTPAPQATPGTATPDATNPGTTTPGATTPTTPDPGTSSPTAAPPKK